MALEAFDRPLLLVGCGNMAGSILSRWLEAGLKPSLVTVVDPGRKTMHEGITLLSELPGTLPADAVILLGIKPQLLPDVAPSLAPLLLGGKVIISMLAGVTLESLRGALGEGADFIRIMPNTPVALGKGVCALYADELTDDDAKSMAQGLLAPLGLVEWMTDEAQFNLITALTGCGPAFVFRFIDMMAQAASELGLEQEQALRLALATAEGASALAVSAGVDPATLADRVASKGGMTREGLDVMDQNDRLAMLMTDTLRAARDRGAELEKLAK